MVQSPPYSDEDRALQAALAAWDESRCPGGDHAIAEAWHSDADGWWEGQRIVCHACTAAQGHQVVYIRSHLTRPAGMPWPPFDPARTVTAPDNNPPD